MNPVDMLTEQAQDAVRAANKEELSVKDMSEAVFDGRLGELCRKYLLQLSPIAYAWPALVTVAGVCAHQNNELRTNLFCALVGDVGSGKSVTIENALGCMGLSTEAEEVESSMAGSAEGLMKKIGDTGGCARLYFPDELSHLLSKAAIEHASYASVLQRCYNCTSFDLVVAKGQSFPFNSSLSIAGGLIRDKFEESFGSTTTAGLYDRFIFGLCPKPFLFDYRPFKLPAGVCLPAPVRVGVDPEIWEAKSEWVNTIPGMTGRLAQHGLRIASICAGFDGKTLLRAQDLGPALEFTKYQIRVRTVLRPNEGQNPDAICAVAILQHLEAQPEGKWVSKRDIYRAIHGSRFGPGIFRRAGDNLYFNEEIEHTSLGRDKRSEAWRLLK